MEYRLKDVLQEKGYIRGPFGSSLKRKELQSSGIPVYEQQHAIYHNRDFRYYIDNEKYREMQRFTVAPNDLIISCSGTIGKVDIISKDDPKGIISQALLILRPNTNIVLPEFLYYFFKSDYGYNAIVSRSIGSVQVNIAKREIIENIKINIPEMPKQRKIVKIFSDIDKKIKLNNKINDNLLNIMKQLYKKWFIDFNFPNNNNQDYKSSGGEIINSQLGPIPSKWTIENLQDVFFFQEGPGIRNWQYVEKDGTKFINIRCIKDDDLYLDNANMISNEEANGKYKHFMLNEWDVVVSTSGTLGKNQIIRKEHLPLCLNTSVIRFKPLKDSDYSFMYNYLISNEFIDLLNTMACGSVQKNFGPTHLKQIQIKYPDKQLLKKFNKNVFPIINEIQKNKSENLTLQHIRDTILPKLLNEEIDIDKIKL